MFWLPSFFDIRGFVHIDWLLFYLNGYGENARSENKSWFLDQDVSVHNSACLKTFLARFRIVDVKYQPYSHYLALCDFILFPLVKSTVKGIRFEDCRSSENKSDGGDERSFRK
ncbi:hypothetical protein AVEN_94362-1 [Araneus ventricosus]|uniref:Uncharacterized protein n=1 Tax=Araneus ventricosus TaxID=182803 RepID=A0A4Y2ECY5_ARAVE|nr:hypothetical protein AVEN_94362-1 [Araneus ventricosus]